MRSIISLTILLYVSLCAACSTTSAFDSSDAPVWVYSEAKMYSNAKFLTATGSASKIEQAKARATSNLAKIFEVQVTDVSTVREDVRVNIEEDIETVKKEQRMASTVNLKTNKMMQGVRIAEQWFNSKEFTYHALAVLDRVQAGNNIRREMNRLDEETQYSLLQSEKRNDTLLKIADLHTATILQTQWQGLQKSLKIIDLSGKGMSAQWSMADLDERLQQALRELSLAASVKEGYEASELASILQGAISKAGFIVKKGGGKTDYQLAVSLDQEEPIKRDGWYWLRATLKLELLSQDDATVIGYQSWPLKVTAGDRSQLQARMRTAVSKKLDDELLDSMLEFAI